MIVADIAGTAPGEQLVEAWRIHSRIQTFVLAALTEEQLACTAQARGRTVADQFAHIHNVRLMWLAASAPELGTGLTKLEKSGLSGAEVSDALTASASAIEKLVEQSMSAGGKVKGFKPHVSAFVGYLISHESYHQGKIDFTLRLAGKPVDDKTHYGMWEWGNRDRSGSDLGSQ
jgi:uncharacterized damage-inducible protein DinB